MKVFVTLGTQKQQFTRILKLIEHSKLLEYSEILVQAGHTKYQSDKLKIIEFMNTDGIEEAISKADFVISHGGVGSIFTALKYGKKVLAVPRLAKYEEHVDDHQIEICKELEKEGYITYLGEYDSLDKKIEELENKVFKKYESNYDYLDILRKEI